MLSKIYPVKLKLQRQVKANGGRKEPILQKFPVIALVTLLVIGCRGGTNIPYSDLLRMVNATICQDLTPKVTECPTGPLEIHDLSGQKRLVQCPGCLTELKIQGTLVRGAIVELAGGGTNFFTHTPSAADAAEKVAQKLNSHYNNYYLVQAARPRGLSVDDHGNLLVTDLGTGHNDGTIWKIPLKNTDQQIRLRPVEGTAIVNGLPSVQVETEFLGTPFKTILGISSAWTQGSDWFAVVSRYYGVGGSSLPGLDDVPVASLLRIKPTIPPIRESPFSVLASLYDFEERNDPDGDGVESNPHDLVERDGYLYITDAAGNDVIRINIATGEMNLYALFEELANPLSPKFGPEKMDSVPTGLTFGPDGALYVAFLTGFPFPQGQGGVYRLVDNNSDGDALDPGEKTLAVTGLTAAIDVAFDAQGSMYTSEYSLDFLRWGTPGRLCQIRDGRCAVTLTDKAIAPTSIVVVGDNLYFSQELAGRVSRMPLR